MCQISIGFRALPLHPGPRGYDLGKADHGRPQGYENRRRYFRSAVEQMEGDRCQVQDRPKRQDPDQRSCRQILDHHPQAVPMVEVYLPCRSSGKCCTADMKDSCFGCKYSSPPYQRHPPAEVNFFHVCEEGLVEIPDLIEAFPTDQKAHACSPKKVDLGVVLTSILLDTVEQPPPCKWVAVPVDESSSCPGSVEVLWCHCGENLWLNCADVRAFLTHLKEFVNTSGQEDRIIVEQQDPWRSGPANTLIAPLRKTGAASAINDDDLREVFLSFVDASIPTSRIDDDDFGPTRERPVKGA